MRYRVNSETIRVNYFLTYEKPGQDECDQDLHCLLTECSIQVLIIKKKTI